MTDLFRGPHTWQWLESLWLWRTGLVVRSCDTSVGVLLRKECAWALVELLPSELVPAERPDDWRDYERAWARMPAMPATHPPLAPRRASADRVEAAR